MSIDPRTACSASMFWGGIPEGTIDLAGSGMCAKSFIVSQNKRSCLVHLRGFQGGIEKNTPQKRTEKSSTSQVGNIKQKHTMKVKPLGVFLFLSDLRQALDENQLSYRP